MIIHARTSFEIRETSLDSQSMPINWAPITFSSFQMDACRGPAVILILIRAKRKTTVESHKVCMNAIANSMAFLRTLSDSTVIIRLKPKLSEKGQPLCLRCIRKGIPFEVWSSSDLSHFPMRATIEFNCESLYRGKRRFQITLNLWPLNGLRRLRLTQYAFYSKESSIQISSDCTVSMSM